MANYTVPPIIGTLKLNNGRVATFYETERGSYERALASGATPVDPPPANTTTVDGKEVSTTADIPPPADTLTTGQSQSTPANNARDDAIAQAPTSSGVGAGTSSNSAKSIGPDNNPGTSSSSTQQIINTAFANQRIVSQPNVLDQYASYTYAISWWLLTPDQYNNLSSGLAPAPGTGNWSLLMQSGGAPTKGRNQFFPDDYYLDDLEIETFLMGKGTNMSTNGMEIKFKVVEPNGLTLLQNLFSAVVAALKAPTATKQSATGGQSTVNANQTSQVPNWGAAQYCLTIEFYGYDENGKLVAPATGQYSPTGQLSNTNSKAIIKKYYPFLIKTLEFRTVANQVEYNIVATAVPYDTATSQGRGTIPFAYSLAGQTVQQLLQGSPAGATTVATSTADKGARKTTSTPAAAKIPPMPNQYNTPGWNNLSGDVQMRAQQSWFDTYGRQYNADGSANWGGG
jgi:hypothetical protein